MDRKKQHIRHQRKVHSTLEEIVPDQVVWKETIQSKIE